MQTHTAAPAPRAAPDRFLIGILIGIATLLVVAAGSVALLQRPAPLLPAGTPSGTIQRFYQALEQHDYDGAFGFLSDQMEQKPTRAAFVRSASAQGGPDGRAERIRIDREQVTAETAIVIVQITHFYRSGPFTGSSEWTDTQTFQLQQDAGIWRITTLPYPY